MMATGTPASTAHSNPLRGVANCIGKSPNPSRLKFITLPLPAVGPSKLGIAPAPVRTPPHELSNHHIKNINEDSSGRTEENPRILDVEAQRLCQCRHGPHL